MKKFLAVLGLVAVVLAGILYLMPKTVDAEAYRAKIVAFLARQTGRAVRVDGPIHLTFALSGVAFDVRKVAIGGPSWGTRPELASARHVLLTVEFLPLFHRRLVVTDVTLSGADIFLETSADGTGNWDMGAPAARTDMAGPAAEAPISILTRQISIEDSNLTVRVADGAMYVFHANDLTVARNDMTDMAQFDGTIGERPVTINFQTARDAASRTTRPFYVDIVSAPCHLTATGKIGFGNRMAILEAYSLAVGDASEIEGKMAVDWGGARPRIVGTVKGGHVDLRDFRASSSGARAAEPATARFLSETPLGFSLLRVLDAELDIALGEMAVGTTSFNHVDAHLALADGRLFLSPFRATLGEGTVEGQFNVNAAATPSHVGLTVNAADLDMLDLFQAGGLGAILSGRVDADMNVVSDGDSMHELASHLSGTFDILGAGGDVLTRATDAISENIEKLLTGGSGHRRESLNCLIARFTAAQGVVRDNGILLDTPEATVAGSGGFDLRGEVIDLLFRARPRAIDISRFLPPLHIGGTFLHPDYKIGGDEALANLEGLVDGDAASSYIPDVAAEAGQNACLAAVNRPRVAADPAQSAVVSAVPDGILRRMAIKAENFLKGWFGNE